MLDARDIKRGRGSNQVSDGLWYSPDLPPQRPAGVTMIAVLQFIGVAVSALIFFIALSKLGSAPSYTTIDAPFGPLQLRDEDPLAEIAPLLVIVTPIAALLGAVLGMGLWKLREWARRITIRLTVVGLVLTIIVNFTTPLTGSNILNILISTGIIVYLVQPSVREVFQLNEFYRRR